LDIDALELMQAGSEGDGVMVGKMASDARVLLAAAFHFDDAVL